MRGSLLTNALLAVALLGAGGTLALLPRCLPVSERLEVDLATGRVRTTLGSLGIPLQEVTSVAAAVDGVATNEVSHWALCSERTLRGRSRDERATALQSADRIVTQLLPAMFEPATNPWRGPAGGYSLQARRAVLARTLAILRDSRSSDAALAYLCATNRRLAGLERQACADDLG